MSRCKWSAQACLGFPWLWFAPLSHEGVGASRYISGGMLLPWVKQLAGYICYTHTCKGARSVPMDNVCSPLYSNFIFFQPLPQLLFCSFLTLFPLFSHSFSLFLSFLLSHSLPFTPISTLAIFRQASVFGEGTDSDIGKDTRQRGVEWQGASHKSPLAPPLKFCGPLAYAWPLSVALVSGSFRELRRPCMWKANLGATKQPRCCVTSPQSFGTWKFPRIFHCSVSQATLGIANSCLVGRPVRHRKHICIP